MSRVFRVLAVPVPLELRAFFVEIDKCGGGVHVRDVRFGIRQLCAFDAIVNDLCEFVGEGVGWEDDAPARALVEP